MELNREQAIDILDRFDFFQGQRAGRELWNGKPFDVQEQDIAKFSYDVALLKNYIKELTEENERLREENETADILVQSYNNKVVAVNKTNTELEITCAKLRVENKQYQLLTETLHDKLDEGYAKFVDEERADTVRKMQEQLKMEIGRFGKPNVFITKGVVFWFIDQIAKEMLEKL